MCWGPSSSTWTRTSALRPRPPTTADRSEALMDLFKNFGQFAGLLRDLPRIKEEMERLQQRLGQITAEGDAGGGMVRVRVNGRMEMVSCSLGADGLKRNDKEMLEDRIRAATNQPIDRVGRRTVEKTRN